MIGLIGALLVLVCVILIITVMVQNPKGGGLSSTFGGGNQILGVQKTTNFIEKTTWTLAVVLVVLVLASHKFINVQTRAVDTPELKNEYLEEVKETGMQAPAAPAAPANTAPATETPASTPATEETPAAE
ncbi:MAG: preprotein translocase subunit SecG [Flavobacteriales bacterium]|jgi:preprotein translocase subunit SecG|nr:preprotein translocase subunit SecG [Flavobacteriales bacterium]